MKAFLKLLWIIIASIIVIPIVIKALVAIGSVVAFIIKIVLILMAIGLVVGIIIGFFQPKEKKVSKPKYEDIQEELTIKWKKGEI